MNERIRELLVEAREQTKEGKWNAPTAVWAEKFAELIVQECVQVVDNMANPEDSERYFWAMQNASEKIKQHFGVRE